MFRFLLGVAIGAAGYWAWQSFGRDLLGMGEQGETTYGGFSSSTSTPSTTYGTSTTPSTTFGTSASGSTTGTSPSDTTPSTSTPT